MQNSSPPRSRCHHTWLLALVAPFALAACQTSPPPAVAAPTVSPASAAQTLAPLTGRRFEIDAKASEVRLLVYRAGPMGRFGHNHVVIGQARGTIDVGSSAAASSFRIQIPVDSFAIDPPAARAEEGAQFSAEVSDAARKGTRANMLGPAVLDAVRHPLIRVESTVLAGPSWNPEVTARVSLRGATRELKFPAAVFRNGDTLIVVATFRIRQTDFGISPFSILGGAIRVGDAVDIRIRLVASAAGS